MPLNLPADVTASLQNFIAFSGYENEVEVIRHALAALERETEVAAIQAGIDDMEAGRYRPWDDVKAELDAKFGFGKT